MIIAAAADASATFKHFDIFMILFTILIFVGVVRLLMARQKNKFAIAFGLVSLFVFLYSDYAMVMNWINN
ncbi:hypothetical protein JCM10914A_14890 [Paenibacillus sp. JCM 10914]|uniref:hypothetical protein n=1 Tax=Paenibacillus sp. JCM 10914 TaxID=1236974 RepID=UPI0003CC624A|nr:hypothetical protein [Paenibacillus sp. JCM 10914]GAE09146.1 hypothetical protein JCM10914_5492 [Paenibacillus sp. JCM 10914]